MTEALNEEHAEARRTQLIEQDLGRTFPRLGFFVEGAPPSLEGKNGTIAYMAPEVFAGKYSKEVDLWALGVITYECLIGKRPYQSDSLGDLVLQICSRAQPVPSHHGSVPAGFDEWFGATQQRDPSPRLRRWALRGF